MFRRIKKPATRFKDWRINPAHLSFEDGKKNEIYIAPRLLKLLKLLMEHPNHAVTRKDLINQVWGDVVVGEESLSKAIFDLRKFLNEHFQNPPKITTIRSVGYRLEFATSTPSKWKRLLKISKVVVYTIGILTILVMVIRGFGYEAPECEIDATELTTGTDLTC